jgi:hypothetical protein
MPEWARTLNSAASAALGQTMMLFGGAYSGAEVGLMLQASEDLEAAAKLLRVITNRPATGE